MRRVRTWARTAVAVLVLVLIGLFDYETGTEINARPLYFLLVLYISWFEGFGPGAAMAFASVALYCAIDLLLLRHAYALPAAPYLNNALVLATFFSMAYLAAALRAALRDAKELSRQKSELLSFTSHELGNCLTVLEGANVSLRERFGPPASAEDAKPFDRLDRAYLSLKMIAENFLNSTRIESGRFELDLRDVDLRQVVEEYLRLAQPQIAAARQEVCVELPSPAKVRADARSIAVVVGNLIGNAVKYTPRDGKIKVSARPAGDRLELSVEDSGVGIDPEDVPKIFGGFYRTERGKKMGKGFGVGLKLSRQIVRAHGSDIAVRSAPGKGSTFSFALPRAS